MDKDNTATHNSPRTWFLTSSLSPLSIRLIRLLLTHGDYVVACLPPQEIADDGRSAEFKELINECRSSRKDREGWKDRIRPIRCDGRVMGQCGAAVAEAVQTFGRIDIMLCCNFEAVIGTVEELSTSPATQNLARDQFETIFFAQVNFIKAALPQLRAQHTGHIMILTSIGGHIGTPGMGLYTAATWALEGFCDSLAYEIAPFNIKITIVQPNKEIQSLTNRIIFAPLLPCYDSEVNPAPSVRDMLSNVLNTHPDTAIEQSEDEIQYRYPKLPAPSLDKLVMETVHALTAIGGHENPPARHIVGFEGSIAVKEKLKTVTEELEDFVEASLAVDIFDSELQAEARQAKADSEIWGNATDARMSADSLLPIAPAKVKALVVPLGPIKRDRFDAFVDRLNGEHIVHLRDVSADGRPNRNMFSPLAFPDGAIFYELMTHTAPPSHLALSPFDLYREPLALIAIADGAEIEKVVFGKRHSGARTVVEANMRGLDQELEELRDAYPKMLVHQVLLFDYLPPKDGQIRIPEGIVTIPPAQHHKRTTMKTVMCDISSLILAEMTTLARSFEGMSYVDSPGQSSTIRQLNGTPLPGDDQGMLSRRNSQYSLPTNSRSSSASGGADRSHVRMSMPPVPSGRSPFGSSSSTPARPSTPVNTRSALSNPPTTFEDMQTGRNTSEPTSPEQTFPSRPDTAEGFRTSSQDRVSVQGFGPGGLNERWRNKGKSRVQIIIGSLYLQAGRWPEAIKELVDGATVAKSINDHLWHGKALELILVSLLLLSWAEMEFTVPTILLPQQEKGSTATATAMQEAENKNPSQPKWLRHLQVILPELLERILALYSRISAEHLPPLPLAEATIRFCRMMTALHVSDGQLGKNALEMMVFGTVPETPLTTIPRFTITPTRSQIASTLFKAFPASSSELLTTTDRVSILGGIASVLGVLGFQRKKAMVVRELVSVLINGLVEARTRGAAEMGIHPAAGLVALNGVNGHGSGTGALELAEGDREHGIDAFLGLLLKTYGVVSYDMSPPGSSEEALAALADCADDASLERIRRQSAARFFGMKAVKLNILRACINFSEALPDFAGVLRFSSDLLRTAGSGIAPGPRRENAYPDISRDEQVRLVTNITKTTDLTNRLGVDNLAAEYWDEFLVRGVKLEPLAATRTPIPHAKSILPDAVKSRTSQDVNPFIYNPFLKQPDKAALDRILVTGEMATFRITLQNPYEIEVEIVSVRLDTEGAEFESTVESTVLGPYRTQILKVTGTPKSAGPMKVTGAILQIRGCRERRFPIFPQPWSPESEIKIKAIGLHSLDSHVALPSPVVNELKPEHLDLNVIAQQPISSVMILEGERQAFSVTLQNLSTTTPVDFLLFSFKDSTQDPLQTALNSRDATAAELYEYELILAKKQALRLRKRDDDKRYIAPGKTATFDFEILGKPGLTNGLIQIDYAYLGVPHDEVEEKFYTRQVSLELTITVNASIEVSRIDVLPLHGSLPRPLWMRTGNTEEDMTELTADKYCLLLIDLRNAWPSHMLIKLEGEDGGKIEENILPGNTSRVILPLKRIYLEEPHAFIPALNPSRQRQFVVSTKISPDVERANREAFWYREKILDYLKGSWTATSGANRTGALELRSMRLTSRMVEAIKVDEMSIELSVESLEDEKGSSKQTNGYNTIFVDEFVQLKVAITNRTAHPIHPTVRLMPSLCHRPLNVALDFTRKFAWNGTLQRSLPVLAGGATTELILGVTALCRGEFEVTASVEETSLWSPPADDDKQKEKGGRPRSDTQTLMDAVLGKKERRIWHSRRPLGLMVRDRP
ncbi:Trs120-domain-containing protein [Thozetella sp. PMI_491]|nr:Trs120-domain-containing protein [Thozetella sp. PMI_491]